MNKYYIGYDIGSSFIKVALVDASTGKSLAISSIPEKEMDILCLKEGWAEQDPDLWWDYVCEATKHVINNSNVLGDQIIGIGIAYQMHGLVVVDEHGNSLRNAIIWCDSRAVEIGARAYNDLGKDYCDTHLLNSPANFTASKLKWVKENEPETFQKVSKYMLPGDYIAYKLTGKITTTKNGLSEGILWDYKNDSVPTGLLDHFGIPSALTPEIVDNFTHQGAVSATAAAITGIPVGTPVTYRSGDQPNNALSLNVFKRGEIAATGGTSGVLYAVSDIDDIKETSRINNFLHVSTDKKAAQIGKLLCINGTGIQYRWLKNLTGSTSYDEMNRKASAIPVGSEGVLVIPFGNGAERMLENINMKSHISNLNFNIHNEGHLYRAALEGIAFSFVYGMNILKKDGAAIKVIRAGNDNLFQSELFSTTLATLIGQEIEIYETTGAVGAARACVLFQDGLEQFAAFVKDNDYVKTYKPLSDKTAYEKAYKCWEAELNNQLKARE
jgi:xylulokinase